MSVRSILVVMAALLLLGCSDDAVVGATADDVPAEDVATEPIGGAAADTDAADDQSDDDQSDDDEAGDDRSDDDEAGDGEPGDEEAVEATVVDGTVVAADGGAPLAGATVTGGGGQAITRVDGRFELTASEPVETIAVSRPGRLGRDVAVPSSDPGREEAQAIVVELEPFTVRGLRVSRRTAADPERFDQLLALADGSTVNALVFDTKDETGSVLYDTDVELASRIGAVADVYEPAELLAKARDHGLYTITRIVVFEDHLWVKGVPGAGLAGSWINAGDQANWRYPLDLAVEACRLGFEEIQFDYVRFPAGRTAEAAAGQLPANSDARSAVIAGFLEQAASELHPLGCGLSAAVFGIVTSSPTDEGIGQAWEMVSAPIDAVSPMVYPSHYNNGWLGLADPEQAPGPVVADALDNGLGRLSGPTLMRPWLQAFNYNAGQVLAQIDEAEKRGAGWLLWSAAGNYRAEWLPPA